MKENVYAAGTGAATATIPADAGHRPAVADGRSSLGSGSWLGQMFARRDLLYMLAWREMKVKYKQSIMGFLWAVLMPALIVSAGVIVKYAFATMSGKPLATADVVSVAVRSVPWAFFVSAIRFGSQSLIANANLVTKIYMPRVIFPIASVASQMLDLAVAAVVLTIFLIVSRVSPTIELLWIPVFSLILLLFVTGLAVFLSAAALFLRDVKYIVEVVLTFAIFFTPVFYDISLFGKWAKLLLINPVAPLLEGLSAAALGRPIPYVGWIVYSAVVAVVTFVGSMIFFKRTEPYFAESV